MKFLIVCENIMSVIFWALIIFGFDKPYVAILTIITALIHECGHIIMIKVFSRAEGTALRGDISGFRIKARFHSYGEELLVSLGGPMINFVSYLLLVFVNSCIQKSSYTETFAYINLLTMVSNLLPIKGYDGYKATESFLSIIFSDRGRIERQMRVLSFTFCCVMCFASLFLLLKIGEGYWIFGIFFSTILSYMTKRN